MKLLVSGGGTVVCSVCASHSGKRRGRKSRHGVYCDVDCTSTALWLYVFDSPDAQLKPNSNRSLLMESALITTGDCQYNVFTPNMPTIAVYNVGSNPNGDLVLQHLGRIEFMLVHEMWMECYRDVCSRMNKRMHR